MIRAFHLENIFAVMCRLVGADYNTIDRTKEDWFLQYRWDEETETKFKEWFADYVHKIKSAQWELYRTRHMRKSDCVKAANMFVLNYGWGIKNG